MKKYNHFSREYDLIQDVTLRSAVVKYMEKIVPDYFWKIGASSSGKYHPKFSQGEGGLVRHTKAVVMFAEELLRMSTYSYMKDSYKDYVIAACIVHDTMKYGSLVFDKDEYKNHAKTASIEFTNFMFDWVGYCPEMLANAIASHMGQWSTDPDDKPFTNIDRCVHMADYMASRSFIDIPQLIEEWEKVEERKIPNTDWRLGVDK